MTIKANPFDILTIPPLVLALGVGCAGKAPPPAAPERAPSAQAPDAGATAAARADEPQEAAPPAGSADARPPEVQPAAAERGVTAPAPRPVRVAYIGMHIGGGPNDAATKAPFEHAIAASFGELEGCYRSSAERGARGTFGIDLLVPKDGGRAEVTNPRTGLKGEGLTECLVAVFERIEFQTPRHGATKLSYSVRLSPD